MESVSDPDPRDCAHHIDVRKIPDTRKEHYYIFSILSRFQTGFCPGFGTGTRLPGQKPLEAFVPGGRTGTKGA